MSQLFPRIASFYVAGLCGFCVVLSTSVSTAFEAQIQLAQAEEAVEPQASDKNIVELAGGNESFTTLVTAVEAAGLAETLSGEGPFTILAPPDKAFEELPNGAVEALLKPENKDLLTEILTYHVIPKKVPFNEFRSGALATLNGGLAVKLTSDRIIINNASIVQADVNADNGVIQVISRVLLPAGAAEKLQALLPDESATAPVPAQPAAAVVETGEEGEAKETPVRGLW